MSTEEQVPLIPDEVLETSQEVFHGVGLCDCMDYKSPVDGKSHCCGRCLCSYLLPFCQLGRIYSVAYGEKEVCCKMGSGGCCVCLIVNAAAVIPTGGCFGQLFVTDLVLKRLGAPRPKEIGEWCPIACGTVCHPCSLTRLRNHVEVVMHNNELKKNAASAAPVPAHQQTMN